MGLDAKAAAATFAILDTHKTGKLTQEQFVTAGIDFFNSDDESSPSKFLWGPLLETKPAEGQTLVLLEVQAPMQQEEKAPVEQWGDFWHKKLNTWAHVVDFDHNGRDWSQGLPSDGEALQRDCRTHRD